MRTNCLDGSTPDNIPDTGEMVDADHIVDANKMVRPPRVPVPPGPGSELARLFASLGIVASEGCPCKSIAAKMDRLGVEGCIRERAEIVAEINARAAEFSWWDRLRAVGFAVSMGLVVNPLDPVGWLFDEAVRRAGNNPA